MNATITLTDSQLKRLNEALSITKAEHDEWQNDPLYNPPASIKRLVMARQALDLSMNPFDYVIGYIPPPIEVVTCA